MLAGVCFGAEALERLFDADEMAVCFSEEELPFCEDAVSILSPIEIEVDTLDGCCSVSS